MILLGAAVAAGCGATKREAVRNEQDLIQSAEDDLQKKRFEDAHQSLQKLINQYPDSDLVAEARLKSAKSLFTQARYEEARAEYQRFLELFPEHERIDEVRFYMGFAYFRQMEAVDRDQSAARQAIQQFDIIAKTMPDSAYAKDAAEKAAFCRRRLADKEMYIGAFYFKRDQYTAAANRFAVVLKDYPGIGVDDEALYYKAESLWRLEQREAAAQDFRRLVQDFPESPLAPAAAARIGVALSGRSRTATKSEVVLPWGERVRTWWDDLVRTIFDTPILQQDRHEGK
jgi:outer membrane protein assembly factor BamD